MLSLLPGSLAGEAKSATGGSVYCYSLFGGKSLSVAKLHLSAMRSKEESQNREQGCRVAGRLHRRNRILLSMLLEKDVYLF